MRSQDGSRVKRAAGVGLMALTSLVVLAPAGASAADPVGRVYTQTNDTTNNKVIAFDRAKNGKLTKTAAVSTGGQGSTQSVGCGPGCPILDSDGAVRASADTAAAA